MGKSRGLSTSENRKRPPDSQFCFPGTGQCSVICNCTYCPQEWWGNVSQAGVSYNSALPKDLPPTDVQRGLVEEKICIKICPRLTLRPYAARSRLRRNKGSQNTHLKGNKSLKCPAVTLRRHSAGMHTKTMRDWVCVLRVIHNAKNNWADELNPLLVGTVSFFFPPSFCSFPSHS